MTETIEYRTIDKSAWPRGPWDDEPDKVQWRDEATGLPCLIHRSPTGALCGCVGLPPGHRWHGVDYDAAGVDVNVHGGLTFAGACQHGEDPSTGICHVPAPGESDDVWWLGFDCAHLGDMAGMAWETVAARQLALLAGGEVYRDIAYVRSECEKLAAEALRVGAGGASR